MQRFSFIFAVVLAAGLLSTQRADAQISFAGCKLYVAQGGVLGERFPDRQVLTGTTEKPVQIDCDDMQFFANYIELYSEQGLVKARGDVLFVSGGNRISADSMEFQTRTRTGTFYLASGTVSLGERAERSLFGTQEPDAQFYGREIHKLGPKKYRVVSGGFTTCVQPTPRWEVISGSATLNIDEYALLTNSVFRVKGVPVMYLPVFYYPMQEDDRATGFTMPIYGNGTHQGHSIKNIFFWAINRSQDASVYHDWYSKTGQGIGGEYRYVLAPGSQGTTSVFWLNERETTAQSGGAPRTIPERRSYDVRADATQRLPLGLYARGNANYFSQISTNQRYEQNVYRATNRTRNFGGNVAGAWGPYSLSATLDRNDTFYTETTFVSNGSLPRVTLSHAERQIGRTPAYFGVTGEYVTLLRSTTRDETQTEDLGLTRFDVTPTVRVPFRRWPFLTANSALTWRGTYWTESLANGVRVPDAVGRRYFDFTTRITGPVFNRIWSVQNSGYANRMKHVIEPSLVIQRVTPIDNRDQIVQLEGPDFVIGNVTRYTYSLTNRLYAKKEVAREILTAVVQQSYYTDQRAVDLDQQYQSSFSGGNRPTHFSPVALSVRSSPTDRINADFRTEWDPTAHTLRTLAASGTFNSSEWLQVSGGWSQRRLIPTLPGFDDPARADHYLNASTTVRGSRNRLGGVYAFNYDLRRDAFLQQRFVAYYNAQCCGVVMDYQMWDRPGSTLGLQEDRRFNISFSLAGIGTFSNLFGALGGQ